MDGWMDGWILSNFHARNGNLHLYTKLDRNRMIHDWDMEIKLFSKWRPSAILNLWKLPFWSHDRYLHVILHLHSEICINRSIQRRDIAKIRFSIWRPSTILNLKNIDFFVKFPCSSGNLHLCTKNCSFGHVSCIGMWLCITSPNFALIGQYGAEILPKNYFQYGVCPPSWILKISIFY